MSTYELYSIDTYEDAIDFDGNFMNFKIKDKKENKEFFHLTDLIEYLVEKSYLKSFKEYISIFSPYEVWNMPFELKFNIWRDYEKLQWEKIVELVRKEILEVVAF